MQIRSMEKAKTYAQCFNKKKKKKLAPGWEAQVVKALS